MRILPTLRAAAPLLALLWSIGCSGPDDGAGSKAPASKEMASIARFMALADDTVRDTRTGLEWTGRDNGRDVTWQDADRHCRTLTRAGQGAWRLPEIRELEALSDASVTQPCGDRPCHLDAAIQLGGPYVWSATGDTTSRYYRDFQFGTSLVPHIGPRLLRRVLCVR